VNEVAEQYRVLPPGTPFPGKYKTILTPYVREIQDEMSPASSTEIIVIMKGAQVAGSVSAENRILYEIAEDPGPLLYVTASDKLADEWNEKRLDPMLELSGLDAKIKPVTKRKGARITGHKAKSKTYEGGGSIYATSYNRVATLRMTSFRTVILDEVDGAKHTVGSEGDPVKNAIARTTAFEGRKKIIILSTPLIDSTSKIKKAFLKGDQRYYNVPCPHCGTFQKILWKNIKYEIDKYNTVINDSVYLQCINEKCHKKIYNYYKTEMLEKGFWKPENVNARANYKSYHISALYAPIGMITWQSIAQEFVDAQENKEELQNWINLRLGEPYKIEGDAPEWREVSSLRSNYKSGFVDENILCVTMACDVQAGSKENKLNPPRIEAEIVGHGKNGKTWAIQYYTFVGSVDDAYSGAFAKLKQFITKKEFPVTPQLILIDAGYNTDIVYEFCRGAYGIFPCMGIGYIKNKMFAEKKLIEFNSTLFELNTDQYKQKLYSRLRLRKDFDNVAPFGYQFFPYDYPDSYFRSLTAEKRIEVLQHGQVIKYKWVKKSAGAKNEALDIRVYNYAALDIFATNICKSFEIDKLDYKFFWAFCEKKIKLQKNQKKST